MTEVGIECSVCHEYCHEEYEFDPIVCLPCMHTYHIFCIGQVIIRKTREEEAKCPTCRAVIPDPMRYDIARQFREAHTDSEFEEEVAPEPKAPAALEDNEEEPEAQGKTNEKAEAAAIEADVSTDAGEPISDAEEATEVDDVPTGEAPKAKAKAKGKAKAKAKAKAKRKAKAKAKSKVEATPNDGDDKAAAAEDDEAQAKAKATPKVEATPNDGEDKGAAAEDVEAQAEAKPSALGSARNALGDHLNMEDMEVICIECGGQVKLCHVRLVCKSKDKDPTYRCNRCRTKITQLYRATGSWPPKEFKEASLEKKQQFMRDCVAKDKATLKLHASDFMESFEVKQKKYSLGGKFLPLSKWAFDGFDANNIERLSKSEDVNDNPILGKCYRVPILETETAGARGSKRGDNMQANAKEMDKVMAALGEEFDASTPRVRAPKRARMSSSSSSPTSSSSSSSSSSSPIRVKKSRKKGKSKHKARKHKEWEAQKREAAKELTNQLKKTKRALTPTSTKLEKLEIEWSDLVHGEDLQSLPVAYQVQARTTFENLTRSRAAIKDHMNSAAVDPSVVDDSKKLILGATRLLSMCRSGIKLFRRDQEHNA